MANTNNLVLVPSRGSVRVVQDDEEGARNGKSGRRGDSEEASRDSAMAKVSADDGQHTNAVNAHLEMLDRFPVRRRFCFSGRSDGALYLGLSQGRHVQGLMAVWGNFWLRGHIIRSCSTVRVLME